jgi:hypothetical protein
MITKTNDKACRIFLYRQMGGNNIIAICSDVSCVVVRDGVNIFFAVIVLLVCSFDNSNVAATAHIFAKHNQAVHKTAILKFI